MGSDREVRAVWPGGDQLAHATLEGGFIRLKGVGKFAIAEPRRAIDADGWVVVATDRGELRLALDGDAPRWLDKILRPPSLARKLGWKPGATAAWVGGRVGGLIPDFVWVSEPPVDLVFYGAESRDELEGLEDAIARWSPAALWVVYPKGVKAVTQADVFAAGLATGWVDNKVCSFSDSHTALRFVRRRDRNG